MSVEKTENEDNEKKPLDMIFAELDKIYEELSSEESLEKSFKLYQKGVVLLKEANDSIDRIEKQVRVLDEEGIFS